MDKLGSQSYKEGKSLFVYKNTVRIPVLGMIDDLCGISKCNWESVITNSVINSFVESKQLEFVESKQLE